MTMDESPAGPRDGCPRSAFAASFEEALDAEPFFRSVVERTADAVVVVDDSEAIAFANAAVERVLGWTPAGLVGEPLSALTAPPGAEPRSEPALGSGARPDSGSAGDSDGDGSAAVPDLTALFDGEFASGDEGGRGSATVAAVRADGRRTLLAATVEEREWDGRRFGVALLREADAESAVRPEDDGRAASTRTPENAGANGKFGNIGTDTTRERTLARRLLDVAPVALSVRSTDSEVVMANARTRELLGFAEGESLKGPPNPAEWTVYDTAGDPLPDGEYPPIRALSTGDPVYDRELLFEHTGGERVWLRMDSVPLLDGNGDVEGVVTAGEEITERKRHERELEAQRERLKRELADVLERTKEAVIAFDTEWRFTYINGRTEELLDRSEADLLGGNLWEEFPEIVGSAFQREYERAMETQEPVTFEEYYPPLSTWFEVRAYPSETGLSVYLRDVTEKRERERALERFEAIAQSARDVVITIDESSRITYTNPAVEETLGYDPDELVGESLTELMDDKLADRHRTGVQQYLRTNERSLDWDYIELPGQHREGHEVPLSISFSEFEHDGDRYFAGRLRDITERREREQELAARLDQQECIAALGQRALREDDLDALMREATETVREGLGTDYAAVLDLDPGADELLLRQGAGWDETYVGSLTVAADSATQAGRALRTEQPVVADYRSAEDRFGRPELLTSLGVVSGISVVIGSVEEPWGVLDALDTRGREFTEHDVTFVQTVATVLATAIDRHQRKRELKQYETAIGTVKDGIYVIGDEDRFIVVNEAYASMVGYDPDELVGRPASEITGAEVNAEATRVHESLVEGEQSVATLETELPTADGDRVPTETRISLFPLGDDEYGRVGVVRDVTERRRFERTLTALHESSRELLRADSKTGIVERVLETAVEVLGLPGVGIYLFDDDDRLLHPAAYSEYVESIFGDPPSFGPGDDAITWRCYRDRETVTIDDVTAVDDAHRYDTPLRSGVWIPLGDHGVFAAVSEDTAAFGPDARQLADLLAATAETALDRVEREAERERYEQRLEATVEKLERSNAELERFAYIASHDLREPLRMVSSYLQLLERRYGDELDGDAREFIDYAVDGADRMRAMIEDLLAYSRVDRDDEELEPTDCDAVLEQALDNLQIAVAESGAEITADRLPTVLGNENRLVQLFQNLLDNAIKYAGEGTPRIDVSAERREGMWEFAVEDNGIGIDPENADQVFEVFNRLHRSDEYSGTGIGLSMCKKIVDKHGGRIRVDSEPGEGSTFYFTLPAVDGRDG